MRAALLPAGSGNGTNFRASSGFWQQKCLGEAADKR